MFCGCADFRRWGMRSSCCLFPYDHKLFVIVFVFLFFLFVVITLRWLMSLYFFGCLGLSWVTVFWSLWVLRFSVACNCFSVYLSVL